MTTREEAHQAINGTDLGGRIVMLNEGRPPEDRWPLEKRPGTPDVPQTGQSL